MKTSTLFAAIVLSVATTGTAWAQEATYENPLPATSLKTRAEVIAELKQAQADGSLHIGEVEYRRAAPFISTVTRAEVRAQTLAALANGDLRDLHGEYNGFDVVARHTSPVTRVAGK